MRRDILILCTLLLLYSKKSVGNAAIEKVVANAGNDIDKVVDGGVDTKTSSPDELIKKLRLEKEYLTNPNTSVEISATEVLESIKQIDEQIRLQMEIKNCTTDVKNLEDKRNLIYDLKKPNANFTEAEIQSLREVEEMMYLKKQIIEKNLNISKSIVETQKLKYDLKQLKNVKVLDKNVINNVISDIVNSSTTTANSVLNTTTTNVTAHETTSISPLPSVLLQDEQKNKIVFYINMVNLYEQKYNNMSNLTEKTNSLISDLNANKNLSSSDYVHVMVLYIVKQIKPVLKCNNDTDPYIITASMENYYDTFRDIFIQHTPDLIKDIQAEMKKNHDSSASMFKSVLNVMYNHFLYIFIAFMGSLCTGAFMYKKYKKKFNPNVLSY